MAKSQAFYKKDYGRHVGATILLITSFLGLVFMTCGVPLGVLMDRNVDRACNTLWGYRFNCWNAAYDWRIEEDTCADRRMRWETAEAFSIVALFSLLFNIGCAWQMISDSAIKTATTLIAVFSIGTTTVPWAIVTSIYLTHYCGSYEYTHVNRKLGTGFILMVVSFGLQCIGFVLFVFIEPEQPTPKASSEEKESLKGSGKKSSSASSSSHSEAASEHNSPSHHSSERKSEDEL